MNAMNNRLPNDLCMAELRAVVLDHASRYPRLEPTDLIKLCYQNEFAGGHMIADESASLRLLLDEWRGIEPDASLLLTDGLGGGLCRLNLAPAKSLGLSVGMINSVFCETANSWEGSTPLFLEKLALLERMAGEGLLPFGADSMSASLTDYIASDCPPVGHSEVYRINYHPHYRVVSLDILRKKLPSGVSV